MVTIVWLILSLIGVCSFSWWPVLIESFLLAILLSMGGKPGLLLANLVAGLIPFSAFKLFCGLNLSLWWLIAAPFWNLIAAAVPGGYTISAILLERYEFMTLPTWMLVVLIIVDILCLISIVAGVVESRNDAKTAGRAGR